MSDLVELIQMYIPSIAGAVTTGVFLLFLVLNISEDFDKIVSFFKRLLNLQKHIDTIYYSKKRGKYNKELIDPDYIKWQMNVLEKIYHPLINRKKTQGWDINITELQIGELKQKYEAITLNMEKVSFPFSGICNKQELETRQDISACKYPEITKKHIRFVKRYYRLVKSTIRYPKRLGYMLGEIHCKKETGNWGITAYSGTYEHNIKTSHVLEYELYKLYKKNKSKKNNISEAKREEILKKLPIRNAIHEKFKEEGDESDILISGKYRESLLSVQMFVLVRNYSNSYDVLRIRRSANVSAKANYLQFIPSGGLEAMNDCNDFDSQWDNYSLCKVIFRELLEECFGIDEDEKKMTGNNVSPDRIYHNEHIQKLLAMLQGDTENRQAYMELMGTTMSLVGLRQEFSFILRVDDASFSKELVANYESGSAIHLVGIENLEKQSFWERNKEKDKVNDLIVLNCTSAGLFELARKNNLYKEALNANK